MPLYSYFSRFWNQPDAQWVTVRAIRTTPMDIHNAGVFSIVGGFNQDSAPIPDNIEQILDAWISAIEDWVPE